MLDLAYTALLDFLARLRGRPIRTETVPERFVAYRDGQAKHAEPKTDGQEASPAEPEKPLVPPEQTP